MKNIMRRLGFPFKKSHKSRSSRTSSSNLGNELLEKRELLAADVGVVDPSMAIFYALSRGGDAMMASMGVTQTDTLSVDGSKNVSQSASLSDSGTSDTTSAFEDEREEAAAVAAVTQATEPITTGFQQAEGAPSDDLIEIPIGLDYPNGQNISLTYNPDDGEFAIAVYSPTNGQDLPAANVRVLQIVSAGELFTGTPMNLEGDFDIFRPDELTKVRVNPPFFGTLSFGQVLPTGLTEQELFEDLTVSGAPDTGGSLTDTHVEIDLQATDDDGNEITEIQVGEEFTLTAFVKDVSSGPLPENDPDFGGVFAGYMDVIFDASLAEAAGQIVYGDDYQNSPTGTISPGLLDEVGAFSGTTELGRGALVLFSIQIRATSQGTLTIASDPADDTPNSDILLYQKDDAIGEFSVAHDSLTLDVVASPVDDDDLAAFAQALADSGAIMYGAAWCPHCTAQKEAFDDGQYFVPFVEVTNPDGSRNQIGIDNDITSYPTWVFGDGSRQERRLTIEELSQFSGVPIPKSSTPIVIGLEDKTLLEGSPLHVPLNGYDPNGGELTYEITSSNPDVVVEQTSGNRSLLIDVQGWGKMLFELYDGRASRATNQIAGLAETGFYDGLDFHRIIDNFMIQGGRNTNNVPAEIDDQFHVDLQHNQSGILSMAKAGDDTNTSQFFITDTDTRHLDGNHTVFGQLIEGDKNRDAINNTATGPGDVPTTAVTIGSASVIADDTENGLVMLRAINGATSGTSEITVKVTDADGNSSTETFTVTLGADDGENSNTPAWLKDIPEGMTVAANSTLNFTVESEDVEGDSPTFSILPPVGQSEISGGTVEVDAGGNVTVTPEADSLADIEFRVRSTSSGLDPFQEPDDDQLVTVNVIPSTPILNLAAGSDSGALDDDDITNAITLDFGVSQLLGSVDNEATVKLFIVNEDNSQTEIGELTGVTTAADVISNNAGTLADDGVYTIVAQQIIDGEMSDVSDPVVVTILRDSGEFQTTAPTDALAQELLTYDADHDSEGDAGFVYSLVDEPTGAVIDADTGELTWTPTFDQDGTHDFTIRTTDIAGNIVDQAVSIDVESPILAEVMLEITDVEGNVIEASRTDTDFILNVYVDDRRSTSESDFGVSAAYIDIDYDETLVSVTGDIVYGADFPDNRTGDTTTTAGLIDEAGASTTVATGPDRVLLLSIPMKTTALGTASFTTSIGDSNPFGLIGHTPTIADETIELIVDDVQIVNTLFAQSDTFDIDEDSGAHTFDVLANDLAGDTSGEITITAIHKTPEINATFTETGITYTPADDFFGTQTFEYDIDDGTNTSTATVTINVANINDQPVAVDDEISLSEDSTDFVLDVLGNDTDVDEDDLMITSIDVDPSEGTASIASDGKSILYTPAADYNGGDTLTYTVSDGEFTSQADVTITVVAINDPPVAEDDDVTTDEDTPITIMYSELLANDSAGPDNESGQIPLVEMVDETIENGTLEPFGTTGVTFTPDENFNGTVTFEYTVTDHQGTSSTGDDPKTDTATVTITVNSVNDAPTLVSDTASTETSAGTIMIDVLANDSDVEGDDLTITDVGTPSNGGTAEAVDGMINYTPAAEFSGTETFTYEVTDAGGATSESTVTVTVEHFIEGGIRGFAYYGHDRGLSGVDVMLTGTDDEGNAVELMVQTAADGSFDFEEVSPGSYTIRQSKLPFMVDGTDRIDDGSNGTVGDNMFTVQVDSAGLGDQEFAFVEQGLDPRYAIWEALASAGRDGVYLAVEPGEHRIWSQTLAGWDEMTITDIRLSANGNTLTITAEDADGVTMEATVSMSDKTKVRSIDKDGDAHLLRLVGASSDFNFTPVTAAEGENPVDAIFAGDF